MLHVKSLRFSFLLCLLINGGCSSLPNYDTVITDTQIIDTQTGQINQATIGLLNGQIAYVGQKKINGKTEIDGKDLWALPGLWDMHVHISDPSFFPLFVQQGIVGVRDMGGAVLEPTDGCESINIEVLQKWREEIESGQRLGPRMVLAGPTLSGNGWPTSLSAQTPETAQNSVMQLNQLGADFVKVYENIDIESFEALVSEAKSRHLDVAGHVSEETLTILDAIHVGQRSIEHVRSHLLLCFAKTKAELDEFFILDHWSAEDREWASPHVEACPSIWESLRKEDVWLTPTLAVQETLVTSEQANFEFDPRRTPLPDSIKRAVQLRSDLLRQRNDEQRLEVVVWNAYVSRLVTRAIEEQTKILAGSDSACEGTIPGFSLIRELQLLVDAGMSELEAIQTATIEPAKYLRKNLGQINHGYFADILLLRANPLADISNLNSIEWVILRGKVAHNQNGSNSDVH